MKDEIRISQVQFTAFTPDGIRTGLIGWIACILNDRIQLDGITLRKTQGGLMTLSFPARQDRAGNQHFYVQPLDTTTCREIETQVFQALGIREKSA